jgi:hypothetical protein
MKLHWIRFTVRRMMALTSVAGLGLWIGLACYRELVEQDRSWLYHVAVNDQGASLAYQHAVPFWPRYWRRLIGRPWPGTYVCPARCGERFDPSAVPYLTVAVPSPLARQGLVGKNQAQSFAND